MILKCCPMNPEHGQRTDTAVIWRPDGKIGFECKHNSCASYTWADVRAKIDPERRASMEAIQGADGWEPPIPLGQFDLPDFPLGALREFCAAVAESYQVPVDLPAMLALAVAGAALAKRIEVHVRGDHVEPVNLFVAVAMEPGERKSAVFRVVSAPLAEYEREENERLAPVIAQNQNDRTIRELRLREAQRQAAKAKDAGKREQARQSARELTDELRNLPVVHPPKYIADDATPEAVGKLLAEQGGRLALLSPEGGTFELMAGRYDRSGAPNLDVYLKGHAGDDLRVDRVSKDRPPEFVVRPALTLGLAVQPEVLRGLMGKPGFRGRGLLGRFLYALPKSLVGYRRLDPPGVPEGTVRAYHALVRAALRLAPAVDAAGKPTPHVVRVSADALAELDRFAEDVEHAVREGGSLAAMKDWANKLVGAVCRIGGVFHGLIYARNGAPGAQAIDAETILCAMAVGEYATAHAQAGYFEMGADPDVGPARRILAWLGEERPAEFTIRDVFNRLRGRVQKVDELTAPLRLLTDHGYIRPREATHHGPGRKPSQRYEVNPLLYAQNAHNAHNNGGQADSAYSAHCAQGVGG